MDAPRSRPLGISILAVVNAIEGVVQIWTGTMFLGFGIAALFTIEKNAVGGYGAAYGLGLIVVGIVLLIVAGGYLTLAPWAWLYGVIVNGISLVASILSLAFTGQGTVVAGIVIPAIILVYLMRPNVKAAFGRS
jgi:hypothetical protein